MKSPDESVALRASVAVLDRTGHGTTSGVEVSGGVDVAVTAEQIYSVIVGTLSDIGVDADAQHVRRAVSVHLRAASAASKAPQRPRLAPVPDAHA